MLTFRDLKASEIDCRISTVKSNGISLLLYKDARVDQNVLDEAVGPFNWQRSHEVIDGNLYCTVSIYDALDGSPMNFPNNGAFDKSKALMISGDFSQLVYSIRQDITFKLFTEGVVQNTDGTIAYNLMQNDMVALRAVMRLGWEIPNPINSLKTDKTKRCPFAVLKSGE